MERARDVIVVGAGVIGLSCAWRCAQAGMDVLVLDREAPGAGASGVAAGMLAPVTEATFGEQALLELNLEARSGWTAFAAELEELAALPTGYRESGALVVAADRDDAEELRRLHALQVELGLDAEWLGPRAARRLEPGLSPGIAGAIHARQDAHATPIAVVRALAVAVAEAGGELRTGVAVAGVETAGGRVAGVVAGSGESLAATTVVIAAGAWSSEQPLAAELAAPPVRPVKGQLLELRVRSGRRAPVGQVLRSPRCYLVARASGEAILGATQEEQGFDTAITADGVLRLLEAAYEIVPDVGELELVRARAGLRPGTPDNLPAVGVGAVDGLVWATGHHRNGVLLAPTTGRAVANLIETGERPASFAALDPGRFGEIRV
jgi:glycine oxidase